MGYFSVVAPGIQTLVRGIFSTPSYPEKNRGTLHPRTDNHLSANLASSVPLDQQRVVQEYSPVVHRLRLST